MCCVNAIEMTYKQHNSIYIIRVKSGKYTDELFEILRDVTATRSLSELSGGKRENVSALSIKAR